MSLTRPRAPRSVRPTAQPVRYRPDGVPAGGWQPPSRSAPAPTSHFRRLFWLAAALAALVMITLVVAAALILIYRSDLVMPGVEAMGIDLGGRSTAGAVEALQAGWAGREVLIVGGDATWTVPLVRLGIRLDARAMVETAYWEGRSGERLEAWLAGQDRVEVAPIWQLDSTVAQTYLWALAQQFDRLPVNASARLVDGRIEVLPAIPGRALDVAATVTLLEGQLARVASDGRLDLVAVPVAPAIADVSSVVAQLEGLLSHSLVLEAYDSIRDERLSWTIPSGVWGTWLTATGDPGAVRWTLDTGQVAAYLAPQLEATLSPDRYLDDVPGLATALAAAMDDGVWQVRTRVNHYPRQHTVEGGDTLASIGRAYGFPYPWIQQANPDLGDRLTAGQVVTIPSADVLLPLPVVENKRIVVSISQQRAWVYQDGALKWEWPVSTGIESSPTSPGVFQVQTHEPNAYAASWDLWMPHFVGIYRPVPTSDFMNGFHGFPTRGGYQLLWTTSLGHPVTYGCILLSQENAAALYDWAEAGTVVEIQP